MSTSGTRRSHALILGASVVGAATAITITGAASATEAHAWDFPGAEIAEQASSHADGSYGGQCKVFAENIINETLAKNGVKARVRGYGTPGGAYYGSYKRAGGTLVDPIDGEPGDLIQVITESQKNSDYPDTRDGKGNSILHSAIIVKRTDTAGRYIVRDSNYVASETVGQHAWTPSNWRKRGAEVYVWRFGRMPEAPLAAEGSVESVGFSPNVVRGKLRPEPGWVSELLALETD